jgi:hypothetical protein
MLARIGLLALAVTTAPTGCDKAFGDGRADALHPGEDIGRYTVTGTITANTCGEGALGEQATWVFPVHMSKAPHILYWDNGQAVIPGVLAADGVSFSFDSGVVMNMRAADQVGLPPCSVNRDDHAEGVLDSAADTVRSFTGELTYTFTPTPGSSCDDLVSGVAPIVAALPCSMSYGLAGQRE